MRITPRHRHVARTLWEAGGRVDEAAGRVGLRPDTLRRWLAEPAFHAILTQGGIEPLLQATSAMLRWAPVAVARLIQDLEGESPGDARQAAREILKLALETQRELLRPLGDRDTESADDDSAAGPQDPLQRQVAALTDEQLARVLAILGEAPKPREPVDETTRIQKGARP